MLGESIYYQLVISKRYYNKFESVFKLYFKHLIKKWFITCIDMSVHEITI